jgi:hypothetical protein
MTKRKPSREQLQFAFMHARLEEDEAAAKAQLEGLPAEFVGDLTPIQAFALAALRDVEVKRAIVWLNENPQPNQDPSYYAGLWEPFLEVANGYEGHPDYGRLFG